MGENIIEDNIPEYIRTLAIAAAKSPAKHVVEEFLVAAKDLDDVTLLYAVRLLKKESIAAGTFVTRDAHCVQSALLQNRLFVDDLVPRISRFLDDPKYKPVTE